MTKYQSIAILMVKHKSIVIIVALNQSIAIFITIEHNYCNTLQYYWNYPCAYSAYIYGLF